jgi:hypothetical protein
MSNAIYSINALFTARNRVVGLLLPLLRLLP